MGDGRPSIPRHTCVTKTLLNGRHHGLNLLRASTTASARHANQEIQHHRCLGSKDLKRRSCARVGGPGQVSACSLRDDTKPQTSLARSSGTHHNSWCQTGFFGRSEATRPKRYDFISVPIYIYICVYIYNIRNDFGSSSSLTDHPTGRETDNSFFPSARFAQASADMDQKAPMKLESQGSSFMCLFLQTVQLCRLREPRAYKTQRCKWVP